MYQQEKKHLLRISIKKLKKVKIDSNLKVKGMIFLKRKIRILLLLSILFVLYIYVSYISLFPKSILLLEGEKLNLANLWGISLEEKENSNPNFDSYKTEKLIQTSTDTDKSKANSLGKVSLNLNLFNSLNLKEVSVNIIPKTKVIPLGNAIGLKLYTEGVLIVGMSQIEGQKPYENTGIKEGDRIIEVNSKEISSTDDLVETVNNSNGKEINLKYVRDNIEETTSIIPVKTVDNEYKLGLWVRDAAAGVGTATFYVPSTGMFAALGHGISDIDTEKLVTISNGELVTTTLVNIEKGEKGKPGEIKGSIEGSAKLGEIYKNTSFGIFGRLTNKSRLNLQNEEMEVISRNEIKKGKAQIICELENGKKDYYDIEIEKIYINNQKDNKSMLIKVTDERLIEKTGGIIQGMSGSPIIQDGKFVGAVTHVLVQNPTEGYAVFADMMLKQMTQT